MWLLYRDDPANLHLVFHLDRVQRKGFARMVLDPMPSGNGVDLAEFFDPSNIQGILDDYEQDRKTLQESYCSAVLNDGGNYRVFIKRDMKSSFVAHGLKNTFGWEREWIVLEFEPDLRRVHINSVSPDVPLVIANRIASAFLGEDVAYDNESIVTSEEQIEVFLESLTEAPDQLPLVELTVKNCGLRGSPQLRVNNQENRTLAPVIAHFRTAVGSDLLAELEDIESIKVHRFNKRVKILFEATDFNDEFVVRYTDQPLTGTERREFETMMEHDYQITVLSTEKRYAP